MEWFDEDDEDDRKPKATNMMSMMMDTKPLQMPLDGTDPATGDDETDQQNESKKEKDSLPQNPEGQGKQEEDEDALDAYMKSLGDKQTNLPTSSSKVGGETSSGERLDMENEDEATAHWELSKQAASTDASIGKNGESAAQSEAAIDAKYALKELSFGGPATISFCQRSGLLPVHPSDCEFIVILKHSNPNGVANLSQTRVHYHDRDQVISRRIHSHNNIMRKMRF